MKLPLFGANESLRIGVLKRSHRLNTITPVLAFLAVLSLAACGGGGGGGSTDGGGTILPSYNGVSTSASISSSNADQFVLNLFDGSSVGGITAASVTHTKQDASTSGALPFIRRLTNSLSSLPQITPGEQRDTVGVVNRAAVVNETLPCDTGTVSVSGNLNDASGTGTLTFRLSACRLDGALYEGQMIVNVREIHQQFGDILDARYTFDNLRIEEATRRYRFDGFFDQHTSLTNDTEHLVLNVVLQEVESGRSVMLENLSQVWQYDSVFYPSQAHVTLTGRVYDSRYGYVDISTVTQLHYSVLDGFPDSGEILLTGAMPASLALIVADANHVDLYLDEDGDANHEYWASKPWNTLGLTTTINSAPIAIAGLNQSISKGGVASLDGSASYDPDHDFISFRWQMTERPQGSQAALNPQYGVAPELRTDVTGNYEITLVVSDGRATSAESHIVITALNSTPQANAGPNHNASPGSSVTLDGQGSTDGDGDPLSYIWTLDDAPDGSAAALSGSDQMRSMFTPDLPGLYNFSLTVNDGEVSSSSDLVILRVSDPSAVHLCDTDNIGALPASGSLLVDESLDFIPLCDGWIYFANRTSNSVDYLNVATGATAKRYPLSAAPGDIELDADNGLLYAGLSPATSIAQIDVTNDLQSTVTLNYPPINMAAGNNGRLFVSMDGGAWFQRPVSVVDGPGKTVVNTYDYTSDYYLDLIAFDRQSSQLIGGQTGSSSSSMFRFSFNQLDDTLTHQETLRSGGGNARDLVISPDGRRFAFPNGGGNGNGYTVFDYSSDALTTVFGEWDTGNYPSGAAFSPFGDRLVAATHDSLQLFDVMTHTKLAEYPLDFSGCDYSRIIRAGYSMGGGIVYAYSLCGFDNDRGKLFWMVVDQ